MDTQNNRYLYIIVFFSGMTTLAVEIAASRLLGSVFGTSNLVWANVIGLILLYLTIGYFVGGRWADRSPHKKTLYQIIIWAAFLCMLIPLIARPILTGAASAVYGVQAALAIGSFVSVLVLFAIPITLLGTVSPFAIRLAIHRVDESGKVVGQIYALSTLGSLIGTFLPVLLIIPELGTTRTFILFGSILFAITWIGLFAIARRQALMFLWMPIVIAVLAILTTNQPLRPPLAGNELLYDGESGYNYIQVQEDANGYRYLYLNEGQGVHSIWHAEDLSYAGTWDYFLAAPYLNPQTSIEDINSVLVIGLAAGTIARQYNHIYPGILVDGIEIDPEILEVGADYFDLNTEHIPNLRVYAEDGRYMLNQLEQQYDLIAIDAYRPPYIPWHLTTVQFFDEVRNHLTDNGVVAMNVGRTQTDRRLVAALANTLNYVFPSVHAIDVPNSFNTILVATQQPSASADLMVNLNNLPDNVRSDLRRIIHSASENFVSIATSDIVFTDDRAPVETLVDSLVLNFLFSDDIQQLQQ